MVGLLPQDDPIAGLLGFDEADLKRQALMQAGLAMLQGSGPSPIKQNLGQIIGQGGMVGMQAYNQGKQQAIQNALLKRSIGREDRQDAIAQQSAERQEMLRKQVAESLPPDAPERNIAAYDPKTALDMYQKRVEREQTGAATRLDREDKLRDDYRSESKPFEQATQAYARVKASADNPSPAGDLALIFNYMKVLDPGSVVRESEFATAAATGAFGERIKAAAGKIASGERLSDEMRQDFVSRAEKLYQAQKEVQEQRQSFFSDLAKDAGVKSENIFGVGQKQFTTPSGATVTIKD